MCIAVLHHISSEARRLRLLRELTRVLRPGGRALVTVWASQQEEPGKLQKWEPISSGKSLSSLLMRLDKRSCYLLQSYTALTAAAICTTFGSCG